MLENSSKNEKTKERKNLKSPTNCVTRSAVTAPKPSGVAGIFPIVCLFCNLSRKKVGGHELPLVYACTDNFEENIKLYTTWRKDNRMLARISCVKFLVLKRGEVPWSLQNQLSTNC